MLGLEAKVSICSTIKENLFLYCRKFSAFAVAIINEHALITSLSHKETPISLQ